MLRELSLSVFFTYSDLNTDALDDVQSVFFHCPSENTWESTTVLKSLFFLFHDISVGNAYSMVGCSETARLKFL